MLKKPTILWLIVLAAGVGLILISGFSGKISPDTLSDAGKQIEETLSPSQTGSKSLPTPSPFPKPQPTLSVPADMTGKLPPAECSLAGSIEYIEPKLYENHEAAIAYKNIDSVARHIIWKVTPNDGLSVSPNLFVRLSLPDGLESLTVGLPDQPIVKNYILTAQVNYGVIVNGNLEIKVTDCSGQIPVNLKYKN